jgi:hypothetical protein
MRRSLIYLAMHRYRIHLSHGRSARRDTRHLREEIMPTLGTKASAQCLILGGAFHYPSGTLLILGCRVLLDPMAYGPWAQGSLSGRLTVGIVGFC